MRLLAPAKINLHLRVGKPRADGFHPLLSWMCTVGLFDKLTLENASGRECALTCAQPDVPCDSRNLVLHAALALADSLTESRQGEVCPDFGLIATLEKHIPAGAGLGGGSSDAARTLLGLNRLWQSALSVQRLSEIAGRLGSDVPFFLNGPSAICTGRGEVTRPTPPPTARHAVLILPRMAMPTPSVYRRFDQMALGTDLSSAEEDWERWAKLPAAELMPLLVNDLEPAAFALEPRLADLRCRMEQILGRSVRMSGSGSSLFCLYDTSRQADEAARSISRESGLDSIAVPLAPAFEDDLNAPVEVE